MTRNYIEFGASFCPGCGYVNIGNSKSMICDNCAHEYHNCKTAETRSRDLHPIFKEIFKPFGI
jgi:hypothetical protein